MIARLGWATTAHGATQGLRFLTSLIVTRLLTPEIFGIMLIINTLRTGAELLSDIGIGQNIVASPNGAKREFLDTAWTLQLLRAALIGIVVTASAWPIAHIYGNPDLVKLMPFAGLFSFIIGFEAIDRFIAQREQKFARFTAFEISIALVSGAGQVLLAWLYPTVWGLIYANTAGAIITVVASYIFFAEKVPKLSLDRVYAREILHFGKWIFLTSIVYFISTNFDRLYLGGAIPLGLLGVFGVARSLTEVIASFVTRVGNYIVFPAVAASQGDRAELRRKLAHSRLPLLLAAAAGLSVFVALSDLVIKVLYDDRYLAAGYILPILAAGVWFTVLTTTAEAVLLGIGRPIYGAAGNAAKLVWLLIGLPLAVTSHGIIGGVIVIALADGVRYLPIWWAQKRSHLSFARQDLGVTLLMFAMIGLWREIFGLVGLTSGWSGWWAMARGLMA